MKQYRATGPPKTEQALTDLPSTSKGHLRTELATLCHDLTNPATCVVGLLELILQQQIEQEMRHLLMLCLAAAEDMTDLLCNIQLHAQLRAERLDLRESRFSISELASSIYARHHVRAQLKGLVLSTPIADGCPSHLYGDLVQLKRILNNLVANAIKYTQKGGVSLEISYIMHAGLCVFKISDTGVGIAEDEQLKIFDMFHRSVPDIMPSVEGIGLGLSIVAELTDLLCGEVSVDSTLGEGSNFKLKIPLTQD